MGREQRNQLTHIQRKEHVANRPARLDIDQVNKTPYPGRPPAYFAYNSPISDFAILILPALDNLGR